VATVGAQVITFRNELRFASVPSTIPTPPTEVTSGDQALIRSGETDAGVISRAVARQRGRKPPRGRIY
jgi:hypothetical protein